MDVSQQMLSITQESELISVFTAVSRSDSTKQHQPEPASLTDDTEAFARTQ